MNKPLPRSSYGEQFEKNYERIFMRPPSEQDIRAIIREEIASLNGEIAKLETELKRCSKIILDIAELIASKGEAKC